MESAGSLRGQISTDKAWNRCDTCGRFIAFDEFDDGASRKLLTPLSDFTSETYETLCRNCANSEGGRYAMFVSTPQGSNPFIDLYEQHTSKRSKE